MADTMRILQIIEPGKVEWHIAPLPQPGAGQLLIKVLGVTTCPHWDLHLMSGEPMFPGRPLHYPYTPGQPGHEATGEVVALGPGVEGPGVGSRVAVWRDRGHDKQGCYAQYVAVDAHDALEVPADLEPEAIAPLELAMCVQVSFDRLFRLDAVRGKRFGVGGLGPAGLVAVQMAKAYGAREVIGIDPLQERQEMGIRVGADQIFAPEASAFPAGRQGSQALDAGIDCTGLPASIQFLMDRTAEAVAIFGVLRDQVTFGWTHWSGLALLGYEKHNREAAKRALELILRGQLDLRPLVTHTLPLTRYVEGVELLKSKRALKVCFRPWDE